MLGQLAYLMKLLIKVPLVADFKSVALTDKLKTVGCRIWTSCKRLYQNAAEEFTGLYLKRDPVGADIASYHHLALQLHHEQRREEDSRSVLLASPDSSDVAAQTSLLLAKSLSDVLCSPVLLVDLCVNSSDLYRQLGCARDVGIREVLAGSATLDEAVISTSHSNLFYLPPGSDKESFANGLNRNFDLISIKPLIEEARKQYDFILFYGGSLLREATTLAVAPHLGRVLLTVVEDESYSSELIACHKSLKLTRVRTVAHLLVRYQKAS